MPRRTSRVCAALAMIGLAPAAAHAQIAACPQAMADKADAATATLQGWKQAAAYRAHYHACDDGDIAEGISEAIVHLLSRHWDELPDLAAASRQDPRLLPFVLRHIDATVDGRDIKTIIRQAGTACPDGDGSLCRRIQAAATGALDDMKKPAD